jgi:hypothetical protein
MNGFIEDTCACAAYLRHMQDFCMPTLFAIHAKAVL